jgi:hypothetical protein
VAKSRHAKEKSFDTDHVLIGDILTPGASLPGDESDEREHSVLIAIVVICVIGACSAIIYHNGAAGASILCFIVAGLIVTINAGRGEGDIVIIPAMLIILGTMLGSPPPQ